jgi:hypothetical protein
MKLIKINSTVSLATWAIASTVFDRSDVRIMGYNLARGRVIRFLSLLVWSCIDWGLAIDRRPRKIQSFAI